MGYTIDVMRQCACLVINPITVYSFGFLFNCTTVGQASNSMTTLIIHCLLLLPFFVQVAVLCVVSSFTIILLGNRAGCFSFVVFWMSCRCCRSLTLPRGAMGWSLVCDCDISWWYSHTFWANYFLDTMISDPWCNRFC